MFHCFFNKSLFFHTINAKSIVGNFIGLLIAAFANAVVKILAEINSFFYHCCWILLVDAVLLLTLLAEFFYQFLTQFGSGAVHKLIDNFFGGLGWVGEGGLHLFNQF